MIFNSILNLMQIDYKGVYRFLCRIFYENYDDLSLDECQLIFAAIEKVREMEDLCFDDFIGCFDCQERVFNILNSLRADGEYGFFTSEEEVVLSELDDVSLRLAFDFFDIFPREIGMKKVPDFGEFEVLKERAGFL